MSTINETFENIKIYFMDLYDVFQLLISTHFVQAHLKTIEKCIKFSFHGDSDGVCLQP